MSFVESLASKGILSNSILATKGVVILDFSVTPVVTKKRGGMINTPAKVKKEKIVKVKFIYKNIEYVKSKIFDYNISVGIKDIDVEIINDRPTIKFKIK